MSDTITIPGWKSFMYCEVWEITEKRGNAIYKTKSTGKFCKNTDVIPKNFTKSSISTEMTKHDYITLPLFISEKEK